MRRLVLGAVLVALVPAAGAGAATPREPVRLVVDGKPTLRVWLATTPRQRALGVHRKPLRSGFGMWFAFPRPASDGFWMQGVSYPLLLAFVGGDRKVIAIRRMAPCGQTDPACPVYTAPRAYRYAVELLPADRAASGIRVGARVRLAPT